MLASRSRTRKRRSRLDAVLRAAYQAPADDLDAIAVRARKLAMLHSAWPAYFAVGIAERRLERWRAARDAFGEALRVSPGCTPAHLEIVGAHVALENPEAALEHAQRACELDGDTARTLAVLATALLAAGQRDEALEAIDRSLVARRDGRGEPRAGGAHPRGPRAHGHSHAPQGHLRPLAPPLDEQPVAVPRNKRRR